MSSTSEPIGPRPAVFFDRDGVLNEPVPDPFTGTPESPLAESDVRLALGAADAVARVNRAGLPVIVVSNQPSAAKGRVSLAELSAVHQNVLAQLRAGGARVDASYLCFHHPDGVVPDLTLACDCRKPRPGLLQQAAEKQQIDLSRSWLIGDTDADVGAARAAGLAGVVVVRHPASVHRRSSAISGKTLSAQTVADTVNLVLARLHGATDGRS